MHFCFSGSKNSHCFFIGAAFGTGSAVAHRAVDAVMGPRTIHHEGVVSGAIAPSTAPDMRASDACNVQFKAFQDVSIAFLLPSWVLFMKQRLAIVT